MRKLFLLQFLLFLLFTQFAYSAHLNFTAYLTGDQEASSVTTNARGTAALTLTETSVTPSGVIFANYKRSGDVKTGTVGS